MNSGARQSKRVPLLNRRLARLLHLSSNIATNEFDHAFAFGGPTGQPPKEIIYVFDHTVMEMFIALDDQTRRYPAAFHVMEWRDRTEHTHVRDFDKVWSAINRQTAIITGEYLLSGHLPGQSDGQFFMTRGHYEEFARGVERRSREAAGILRDNAGTIQGNVDRLREILVEGATDRAPSDPYLQDDVSALGGDGRLDRAAVEEFTRIRRIAQALSENEGVMRIRQLNRATSPEILDRIAPLDIRFPSPENSYAYQRFYEDWRAELQRADTARSKLTGTERPARNIRRDAEAIALVQWAARAQGAADERIVFVTGDPLLTAAYAKWHKNRVVKEPGEPRILRSIQQFAPILNLGDMKNGITDAKKIFEMLREGVEAPLLAFNLSSGRQAVIESGATAPDMSGLSDEMRLSSRTDLALRLEGNESYEPIEMYFKRRLTPSWYRENLQKFNQIARSFRELERLAIGLSAPYVEGRASIIRADLEWEDSSDLNVLAKEYIERLLEGVNRQSMYVWFPVALHALGKKPQVISFVPRTPRALRLLVPTRAGLKPLVDLVDAWFHGEDVREKLPQPLEAIRHVVFAIASAAELSLGFWSSAHRYSQLALSAAIYPLGEEPSEAKVEIKETEQYQELRYLRAVCCRMMIGAQGPTDLVGDDVWATLLDQGIAELQRCEAFHAAHNQPRRQLRAISERAAIRGFYVLWLPILDARLSDKTPTSPSRGYSRGRAIAEFRGLLVDLVAALALIGNLDAPEELTVDDELQLQVYANVAAAYTLTKICADCSAVLFEEILGRENIEEVVKWWRDLPPQRELEIARQLPPLVRRELAIFYDDYNIRRFPDAGEREARSPDLQLDREVLRLIKSRLNSAT